MAGAHFPTILEINFTAWHMAVIQQHACGPAHVAFNGTVAIEGAVEQNNGAGMTGPSGGKPNVVGIH